MTTRASVPAAADPATVYTATLENRITLTIHEFAFVPLDARYRIARQLIADRWRKDNA